MILGLITLLTALCISGIAAYYSIVGLTAIFAAAYWPIVIMGGVLEVGKVVTTLWLHYNWARAEWKIKSYLVTAVGILMLITSMGIFGFLSKSHLDQAVPSGDVQAQVQLFDEKIKTQRDNIESDRKALTQLDSAVDQMLGRTTDEQGATKSANLRSSQKKERARLQADIDESQKTISKLQEERSPIASKLRKVEAEVGPIKYIAALLYGDKADQNTLEAAVRWVIIIIVLVFDPLAIVLILAATTSIDWSKLDRKKRKLEEIEDKKETARLEAELTEVKSDEDLAKIIEEAIELTKAQCARDYEVTMLDECGKCSINTTDQLAAAQAAYQAADEKRVQRENELREISSVLTAMNDQVHDLTSFINGLEEEVSSSLTHKDNLQGDLHTMIKEYDDLLAQKLAMESALELAKTELTQLDEIVRQMGVLQGVLDVRDSQLEAKDGEFFRTVASKDAMILDRDGKIAELTAALEKMAAMAIATPLPVLPPIVEEEPVVAEVVEEPSTIVDEPVAEVPAKVDRPILPPLPPMPVRHSVEIPKAAEVVADNDNFPMGGNASFGVTFPGNPIKGDLYLRVDYAPSKLFKWEGKRWMEIDKAVTDAFSYEQEYIKLLVAQIESGEVDADDLTDSERENIAAYLRKT